MTNNEALVEIGTIVTDSIFGEREIIALPNSKRKSYTAKILRTGDTCYITRRELIHYLKIK